MKKLINFVVNIHYWRHQIRTTVQKIYEIENLIQQNESLITPDNMKDIQAFYRTFWVKRYVNLNAPDALVDLFYVYEKHLNKGYLYREEMIFSSTLQTLTNIGLKLKKFEWVKTLLDNHKPLRIVGKDDTFEIHNFLLANYYFSKMEYDKAEEILVSLKFKDIFYDIQVYFLIIKIYYEQNSPLLEDKIISSLYK